MEQKISTSDHAWAWLGATALIGGLCAGVGWSGDQTGLIFQQLAFILPAAYTVLYILSPSAGHRIFKAIWAPIGFAWRVFTYGARGGASDGILRGTRVTSGDALARTVRARTEKGNEEITIGGVPIPFRIENRGILMAGKPGSGKSVAIDQCLYTIDKRPDNRVFLTDRSGEYLQSYYNPDRGDVILSPFDQRAVPWSPLAEIRDEYDCQNLAKSFFPDIESGDGNAAQFQRMTQVIAEALFLRAWQGNWTNGELYEAAVLTDFEAIKPLLAGTVANSLLSEANVRMAGNAHGLMGTGLGVLGRLNPEAGRHDFSIREYVSGKGNGWLFFPYETSQRNVLNQLIGSAADTYCSAVMMLPPAEHSRRLWLVMDEASSLGKVASLEEFTTNSRKHGGSTILGLQNISQFNVIYGAEKTKTILSTLSTQLIFSVGDADTAEVMSRTLGDVQVSRTVSNTSSSTGGQGSTSQGSSEQIVIERAVLGSQIQRLPDLTGYLKLSGDFDVAKITLDPRDRGPAKAKAYEPAPPRESAPAPQPVVTERTESEPTGNSDLDALDL